MFAYVKGVVTLIRPSYIVVDVSGVGIFNFNTKFLSL